MTLLISGLLLWSLIHLTPAAATGIRQRWIGKLGESGYALSFAVLIVISLVMIVFGWRGTSPVTVYEPLGFLKPLSGLLMLLALFLFVASSHPTRLKRLVRHPQMTGVILWSAAHLPQSGTSRGMLLFGGLAVWAILEIVFCNRRDGEWEKPPAPSMAVEIRYLIIGFVVFAVFLFAHPFIAGVSVL